MEKRGCEEEFGAYLAKKVGKLTKGRRLLAKWRANRAVRKYKPRLLKEAFDAMLVGGLREEYLQQHALKISELLDSKIFEAFEDANLKRSMGVPAKVYPGSIFLEVEDELLKLGYEQEKLFEIEASLVSPEEVKPEEKSLYV